ncbi:ATP-binding protein [Cupriavidus pauculus]|uniref:ATP-binding protein n=1 Tax=Cupriavidus pauculus TaxID=82633 RepID=UPI001EE37FC3|nr:ATP-binding protein [Cupriavidus pauculus]
MSSASSFPRPGCSQRRLATWPRQCTPEAITLVISDRGPGIPTDVLDKVFNRVEPSRNRSTGGMGLGLTSALAVIRAHAGDIVLGNREGGGLAVCVTLPVLPKTHRIHQGFGMGHAAILVSLQTTDEVWGGGAAS